MITDYGLNLMLKTFFEKGPVLELALYRETSSGTKEVFGGGYERLKLSSGSIKVEDQKATNEEDLLWPPARRDWGKIVAVALVTQEGEEIARNEVEIEVHLGEKLRVPAKQLVLTLISKQHNLTG